MVMVYKKDGKKSINWTWCGLLDISQWDEAVSFNWLQLVFSARKLYLCSKQ